MITWTVLAVVFTLMAAEGWMSLRHERWLRARGAVEPPGDPYPLMALVYPASFAAMGAEGLVRGPAATAWLLAGAALLTASKALKYWAIAALGRRWSFRVLTMPGTPLVATGPYRFLRHPNYVAVMGELAGMAAIMSGWITGPMALAAFGAILRRRVAVEERALGLRR